MSKIGRDNFIEYLINLNNIRAPRTYPPRHDALIKYLLIILGTCIGIYTLKVGVEQMVMQLRL